MGREAGPPAKQTQPPVPPISTPTAPVSQPPPPPPNYTITCGKKRDIWDRIKFAAEIAGIGVVIVYTSIAALQWCEMKRANKLTGDALELNRKMFNATQAAGFACQINQNIGTQMTVQISCSNRGRSAASNVAGEIAFTRSERGRIVQQEKRPINERIILEGSGIDRFFFVTGTYSWEWMLGQDMTGSVSLNYGNGIENVSQSSCWKLLTRPRERSTTFTDCVNYADVKKSAQ